MTRKVWQCEVCHGTFKRQGQLEAHFRSHTGERPFKCPQCDKAFIRNDHLKTHIRQVHDKHKPFACPEPECPMAFAIKGDLDKHSRVHNKVKKHACTHEHCDQAFAKKDQLRAHLCDFHGDPRPYPCNKCGQRFGLPSRLKAHERKVHERKYVCETCKEEFEKYSLLVSHRRVQHPKYVCPHCDKVLGKKDHYTQHVATHEPAENRPLFICPVLGCERSYSKKSNLNAHTRVYHQGETKQYRCSVDGCDSVFDYKHSLARHAMRRHRRPSQCTEDEAREKQDTATTTTATATTTTAINTNTNDTVAATGEKRSRPQDCDEQEKGKPPKVPRLVPPTTVNVVETAHNAQDTEERENIPGPTTGTTTTATTTTAAAVASTATMKTAPQTAQNTGAYPPIVRRESIELPFG
eukprot:TRINITY_DN336_c0_g1_i10.p1 TRINITY_DN336_c0_g1~~TRINITY_DN336_c0_g1_i10.p1  ORF type:complete len:408 (+),score=39.19 TRINITY_DN336_c0_g1_i10:151-1374(+)